MRVIIGNAVCDENGKSRNGKPGDQKQTTTDDFKGEVKLQDFYVNKKGWYILRLKNKRYANTAAKLMKAACNNKHIGYSQSDRYGVIKKGIDTREDCNCDCSSLVREVLQEATGKSIPDFSTENEVNVLQKTGLFQTVLIYDKKTTLYTGDVIVTKTKGHTAIVVEGMPRSNPYEEPDVNVTSKANAKKHKLKNYICEGEGVKWVQYELCQHGYQSNIDNCGGIDGNCGKGTVACIEDFQKLCKLEEDGICGVKTREWLKK